VAWCAVVATLMAPGAAYAVKPSTPTGLRGLNIGSEVNSLSWNGAPAGECVTYILDRGVGVQTPRPVSDSLWQSGSPCETTATSLDDSGPSVRPGRAYFYDLRAVECVLPLPPELGCLPGDLSDPETVEIDARPYAPHTESESSPFNYPILESPPIAARSSTWVNYLRFNGSQTEEAWPLTFSAPATLSTEYPGRYSNPVYYSRPSDPSFTIHCLTFGCSSVEGLSIKIPDAALPASDEDAHMTVVASDPSMPDFGTEYDFWRVGNCREGCTSKPAGGGELEIGSGDKISIESSGLIPDVSGYGGANAAQTGLLGGLVRGAELRQGSIPHAIAIAVDCVSGDPVYPASGNGDTCDTNAPPMGALYQLNISEPELATFPRWKQIIFRAMKQYGMYVVDTGGGGGGRRWEIAVESPNTYTSFGLQDELAKFAADEIAAGRGQGITLVNGVYKFALAANVNWAEDLRVLDPPPHPKPPPVDTYTPNPNPPQTVPIPSPAAAQDTSAPILRLRVHRTQRVLRQRGRLMLQAKCNERCLFAASGTITVLAPRRIFGLKKVTRTFAAGVRETLRVKLSRRALAAVKRALKQGKRVKASLTLNARDDHGNVRSVRRTITLRR
jgi:hypothetical protein